MNGTEGETAGRCREHTKCALKRRVTEIFRTVPGYFLGSSHLVLPVAVQDCVDHKEGKLQA